MLTVAELSAAAMVRKQTIERQSSVRGRAGLTIVSVVPWEGAPAARGPPINCQIFIPRCVDA